jgi:predicted metalloprotease with PDZ domain
MKRVLFCVVAIAVLSKTSMTGSGLIAQNISSTEYAQADEPYSELPAPLANNVDDLPGNTPAYLGITFDPQVRGAAVARAVAPGSPADLAGVEPGDVIEALNNQLVESHFDAIQIISAMRPGELLDIDFSRRMQIRTQASLVRQPVDAPRETATYSRGVNPRPVTEESLPAPAYRQDRLERAAAGPYNVGRNSYRVEQTPRNGNGRFNDRGPQRPRALLPWRRRG